MKNKAITLLLIILLSMLTYAQNTYNVQPGVKNNQIVLELKNISDTEQISLTKPLQKRGLKHIIFSDNIEETIVLNPKETKEIVYTFDIDYNIGTTKSDTIEFTITDGNAINITKQFILQYTIPTEYKLEQNYPNPFNPTTKIRYSIAASPKFSPKERTLNEVRLKVYDILGNEIVTLVEEQKEAGYYEVEWDASRLASGVYIYRLQAGNFIQTKKMVLLR